MPPLVPIAIAWTAGLVASHHILTPGNVQPTATALLGLIPLVVLVLWRRDRSVILAAVCALAFVGGLLRYQGHMDRLHAPDAISRQNERGRVTLEGIVRGYPDVRDGWTGLILSSEQIYADGEARQARGRVLLYVRPLPAYHYGDRLRVTGMLETPPEIDGFSYREYLAQRGILSSMQYPQIEKLASGQGAPLLAMIFYLRSQASAVIARLMPEPEASLLQGILLGIRSSIPRTLYEDYNRTGTSHIIVISGANIMIVAAVFTRGFGWLLGKRKAFWLTQAGIAFYILLVGADPVVVRAGIMGSLLVTAVYLGRRATAYVSIAAAALLLTLINPLTLWDVGFQLSAAATLGLILFTEPMEEAAARLSHRVFPCYLLERISVLLAGVLIVTLAAQMLTFPLVIYHFGQLSLVAPLTNLFVVSIQPHIMLSGALATMVGLVPYLEPVARVIAFFPWLLLAFTNGIIRLTATWPLASVRVGGFLGGSLLACYLLALTSFWALRFRRSSARRMRERNTTRTPLRSILALSVVAIILTILGIEQLPDGRLHVAFLDVGQGDAILITSPRGSQILVDGGPDPGALTSALGRAMPFWDHDIELVVLTHADIDHVGGLPAVLERYEIRGWLDNGAPSDSMAYVKCQELLQKAGVSPHAVRAGDQLDLGDGVKLQVLHPGPTPARTVLADSNNSSVVLRLVWGDASFLLTGDLEAAGEGRLLDSDQTLESDILKVSHHGSGGASTPEFLAKVAPSHAVISAGEDNKHSHPDQAVLERLASLGDVQILRTDKQGTLEFVTDGRRLWVHTER
jgi:competence protein ComEC